MEPEPNVTDWIAAVSTAGALLAALVAAIVAWRTFRHNRQDRRAEQASRVAAWVEWRDDLPFGPFRVHGMGGGNACIVLNSSPLPVYDVMLAYWMAGAEGIDKAAGPAPQGLMSPGETTVEIRQDVYQRWQQEKETYPHLLIEIRFTDSAGRRWWRAWNGELVDKGRYEPGQSSEHTSLVDDSADTLRE